ncbi:MAG: hypothetical protein H6509_11755 [Bryobacterales bacterium]|nr:hypothetical protein [Acidobacteriota bacterium]MCB9385282.1 hypothetical protein [Bryobacterales bacterium]
MPRYLAIVVAAIALRAVVLLTGCGPSESRVTTQQLEDAIASAGRPIVVLLWADWSRASVELLPTAAELAVEYESSATFWTVCLERTVVEPKGFPLGARHFVLEGDPTIILSQYELQDVPAALLFEPGGKLHAALGSHDDAPLSPADLADAIESFPTN